MTLPKDLTTVTPLLKTVAAVLFVLLPLLAFFGGMQYQKSLMLSGYSNEKDGVKFKERISKNPSEATDNQEYFSCLPLGGSKLNEEEPYKKDTIVFKAKDGISEQRIIDLLNPLGYDLKTVNSSWGYAEVERSTLFIRHTMKPDEAKNVLIPIVSKFEIIEVFPTSIYYEAATIYFTKTLSDEQQKIIDDELDILKTQGDIAEYGWNKAPKQQYGFLAVPEGRTDEYIDKVNNLGIFDCVSEVFNIIPIGLYVK